MTTITAPRTNEPEESAPATSTGASPRRAAQVAGVGYVLLFALGLFANFFVREALIVTDDPATTASNIADSEGLFRLGMASFLAIFLLDVVVAWALYVVFRGANRDASLLTAWFRLIYTVMLGVAIIFFFQALQLLSGSDFLVAFDNEQLQAQALVAFASFNSTWLIGLAAFGVHLIGLGYLVVSSRYAPRVLGYILMVAGTAYVVDTVAHTLLGNYNDFATVFLVIVAVPSIIAEGWFGLWLLLRAGTDRRAVAA